VGVWVAVRLQVREGDVAVVRMEKNLCLMTPLLGFPPSCLTNDVRSDVVPNCYLRLFVSFRFALVTLGRGLGSDIGRALDIHLTR